MIVTYCFFPGDINLALKNAQWINELGGCRGHEVLMGWDKRCDGVVTELIDHELTQAFDKIHRFHFGAVIDGWPEGANYFFRTVAGWMQTKQYNAYFWMEPDAIPLRERWLDMIVQEYATCGKPFLGDRVQVNDIPLHMSGVGIYPNPLHRYAGEAYRAFDTAWDMAGKDQIIAQAHFTNLIEHAWKHPKFTNEGEIRSQIAPETILFHSSKDGSLIDLLRGRKQVGIPVASTTAVPAHQKEPEEPGSPFPIPAASGERKPMRTENGSDPVVSGATLGRGDPLAASTQGREYLQGLVNFGLDLSKPSCDIFIRTYPRDYEWLSYCVRSIEKFAKGFRKVWIVSSEPIYVPVNMPGFETKMMNDETEDGYLAQQITKLYADVITDYQADYILHVDSDVIFTRETTPEDFFFNGKPMWMFTPYKDIQTPWQPITEKFMGETVEFEFMRRFPIIIPRWLYPRLREFCHKRHGVIASDYVRVQPLRAFSEFNALGAYAYKYHNEMFSWYDTRGTPLPEVHAKQYHSWGGITPEIKAEIENTLNPTQIKVLPNDIWVIKGDTHVSKWVEEQRRLDHDQNTLPFILPHIRPGDTVIDAGAFIGDHTIAYAKAAGIVLAFEPNPVAFECLQHNLRNQSNVTMFRNGLGDRTETVKLSGNNGNWAGSYVGDHMVVGTAEVNRLDDYKFKKVDLIKWDIEGYEVKALHGAENTINRCRPKMVIEVNQVALERQHNTRKELFEWLKGHGYKFQIIQETCKLNDPLYDILCLPISPEVADPGNGADLTRCPASPPVTLSNLKQYIQDLADFSNASPKNKAMVMQRLVYTGLKKKAVYKLKK